MKVSVIIPTLNEEKTIASVIKDIKERMYVIDASSDRTAEIAKKYGAEVVFQKGRGKGDALRQAFSEIDSDVYVTIDGDGTYEPKEIPKLIEPIASEKADFVIGSRIMHKGRKNITFFNLLGNLLFNLILRFSLRVKITDMLSGFRAINKKLVKEIKLVSEGFEVETEMTVKALKMGYRIKEVPVSYRKRTTPPKLNPIKDGAKISLALIKFLLRGDNF